MNSETKTPLTDEELDKVAGGIQGANSLVDVSNTTPDLKLNKIDAEPNYWPCETFTHTADPAMISQNTVPGSDGVNRR